VSSADIENLSEPTSTDTGPKLSGLDLGEQAFTQLIGAQLMESSDGQLNAISPIALAYIGDAVFELYVRSQLLHPLKRIRDYHQAVVSQVKAEKQSHYVDVLSDYLTDAEKDIIRRGRNATTGKNRRAKGADYQKATGFEALVGSLYLSDLPRLLMLLRRLDIH